MSARPRWLMLWTLLAASLTFLPSVRADEDPEYNELEKAFQELLTGSEMVGTFTIVGKTENNPPKPERYQIQSATKLKPGSDYWVIVARVQYGEKQATLPIPVTVKVLWAGDTPMITLTDLSIPSLGTFTARVLFHGDRYAGTWQHDNVGGHMYGVIQKPKSEEKPKAEEKSTKGEETALILRDLQGGFAGFTGIQFTIQPNGKWSTYQVLNENLTLLDSGKLSPQQLKRFNNFLKDNLAGKFPEQIGKPIMANPHLISLQYGELNTTLILPAGSEVPEVTDENTPQQRLLRVYQAVRNLTQAAEKPAE